MKNHEAGKLLFERARQELAQRANAERAQKQEAYMKSRMLFWGVPMPEVVKTGTFLMKDNKPIDRDDYRATVDYFFRHAQRREEWYLGMLYAKKFKNFITQDNMDLYIDLVLLTQWWDIVDEIAVKLVGQALKGSQELAAILKIMISDENMWVRRAALLAQLKYKEQTNPELLAYLIMSVAHEKEFFIRKAIGWVLREYSYTNPEWVVSFITHHEQNLSGLSVREGLKGLQRTTRRRVSQSVV
jgi:3-methyladenine DNA glycosylase AlkD